MLPVKMRCLGPPHIRNHTILPNVQHRRHPQIIKKRPLTGACVGQVQPEGNLTLAGKAFARSFKGILCREASLRWPQREPVRFFGMRYPPPGHERHLTIPLKPRAFEGRVVSKWAVVALSGFFRRRLGYGRLLVTLAAGAGHASQLSRHSFQRRRPQLVSHMTPQ